MTTEEKRSRRSEPEVSAIGKTPDNNSAISDTTSTHPSEVFDSAKYNAMSDMTLGASLDTKNIEILSKNQSTLKSEQIDNKSIITEDKGKNNYSDISQTQKITPMMVEERARTIRAANEETLHEKPAEITQTPSVYYSKNDKFIMYLNIVLSMENAAVERLHGRIQQSPLAQIRQQLVYHLEETREQKDRLISLISRLGGQPTSEQAELPVYSPPKSLFKILNALSTTPEEQELKTLEADALIEHAEIICYNTLIQMAIKMNIGEAIPALRQNLQEEEKIAAWMRANLPSNFVQLWTKI